MRLLPVIALLALVATPAEAAPPVYDWGGAYAGFAAGAAFGHSTATTTVDCSHFPDVLCWPGVQEDNGLWIGEVGSGSASSAALLGGVFTGYNWQSGNIVFGLEGDVSAMPLRVVFSGTAPTANEGLYNQSSPGVYDIPSVFTVSVAASTDWIASVRGRFGFLASPSLFLYGTAGVAATELTVANSFEDDFNNGTGTGNREASSTSALRTALIIGAGAEWAFAPGWTIRGEYLHTDFGSLTTTGISTYLPEVPVSNPITSTANLRVDIVRIGVAYGF